MSVVHPRIRHKVLSHEQAGDGQAIASDKTGYKTNILSLISSECQTKSRTFLKYLLQFFILADVLSQKITTTNLRALINRSSVSG